MSYMTFKEKLFALQIQITFFEQDFFTDLTQSGPASTYCFEHTTYYTNR